MSDILQILSPLSSMLFLEESVIDPDLVVGLLDNAAVHACDTYSALRMSYMIQQ